MAMGVLQSEKEVEAKFLVKGEALLAEASALTSLGPFCLSSRKREKQRNTYLDTPGLRLRKARGALKLRQVGRRAEVTFKRELKYRQGVSERVEVTVPLRKGQIPLLLGGATL